MDGYGSYFVYGFNLFSLLFNLNPKLFSFSSHISLGVVQKIEMLFNSFLLGDEEGKKKNWVR